MTPETLAQQLIAAFKIPPQDLAALSFCGSNRPSAVKSWAESLPATRINYSSVLLYKALPEINRLEIPADSRLAMLEAVRPYVQQCIQGLAKHFLNQPLILPEAPLKSAVIAQALQKNLSTGYSAVLADLVSRNKRTKKPDANLSLVIHRMITGIGLMLLRSYQLYSESSDGLWLELHSLYRLANHYGILEQPVREPLLRQSSNCTIIRAYTRILLLASARPNQMRQTDVSATYDVLEIWAQLAKIRPAGQRSADSLFLLNLSTDTPPLDQSRFAANPRDALWELDTSELLAALKQRREMRSDAGADITVPHTVSSALLEHLEQAWGASQQRSAERRPSMDTIDVCVGLSSLHYHASGEVLFDASLGSPSGEKVLQVRGLESSGDVEVDEIDFGSVDSDPWANALGANSSERQEDHRLFPISIVDNSPGGYCLEWRDRIPPQLKAGEVLGLRERGRYRWSLGVVRWLQQQSTVRLGVQLLAPKAEPYGAAIEQPGGDFSDYRRVLMLPEIKAANQPATLVTAFAPFQENHRLMLNNGGRTFMVQLGRRVFSTGSISQFTFRVTEADAPTHKKTENENGSSPWDNHVW